VKHNAHVWFHLEVHLEAGGMEGGGMVNSQEKNGMFRG